MEAGGENIVRGIIERERIDFRPLSKLMREGQEVGDGVEFAGQVLGAEAALRADQDGCHLPGDELDGAVVPGGGG